MRKTSKRVVTVLVMFTMIFSATLTTVSATTISEKSFIEKQVEQEIEAKKAAVFADIYQQLEEQNALSLMDEFVAAISPEIEYSVKAKYNIIEPKASPGYLVMDRGGVMSYETRFHATVLKSCFLPYQAQEYLVPDTVLTIGRAINDLLGNIKHWSYSVGLLLELSFMLTEKNNELIRSGKYVMVTQIKTAYESGTTVLEWDNFPLVAIPDAADRNNYHVAYF